MPIGYQTIVDDADLIRGLKGLMRLGRSPRQQLGQIGLFMRRGAQPRLRRRPKRPRGVRTHRLEKSLTMRLQEFEVVVGSNLIYAAIQQLGGTVKPRTAKALAIPMLPHLARRGVWPRDLPRDSMRYVANRRSKGGRKGVVGYLFRAKKEERVIQRGKNKGKTRSVGKVGELMYLLVSRSKIKGQPYLIFGPEERGFSLRVIRMAQMAAWRGR